MTEPKIEICSACGVQIENNAKVNFSFGKSGTREKLWARVCRYAKTDGCINLKREELGEIKDSDYYG